MVDLYHVVKLIHIGSAIVAVGANVTYAFWLALAGREPTRLTFTISGIRRLDSRVANPAYIVLLVTGLTMVFLGGYSLLTPWLFVAIVLYVATAVIGITLYAPAVRRQLVEAEADPLSDAYEAAARRSNVLGVMTVAIVSVIVGLMVLQPA